MIKLFYRIFKKQILKIQYLEQSKKPGFERLEYKFVDSKGKKYYSYPNDFDIPLRRKGELERVLIEIESGLSKRELNDIVNAMEKALIERKGDNMIPNIGKIGYLLQEIKNRQEILLHPELLFEAVAILYIREDENPAEVDKEILNEKIEQFRLDSKGGLYDFFYSSGIVTYLPFLGKSEEEWTEYYNEGIVKVEALKKQISILGQESLTT